MILLLGGSGFIGTDIASTLKKHQIPFISPLHHELNLNEKTNIFQFFEKNKIETIIWSVSTYNPLNISNTIVDHILFRNVLDVCEALHKNIIYLGSMSEVNFSGKIKNDHYFHKIPISQYGKSKQAISKMLECSTNKIKKYNLRLFGVFGDGEPNHRLIPSVIDSINFKRTIKLSDCEQIRDFINVKVISEIVIRIIENKIIPGGLYNIGSGIGIKIKELLLKSVPESKKKFLNFSVQERRETDLDKQIACIQKSNKALGLQQVLNSHMDVMTYLCTNFSRRIT
jgi:nucleoside-diphosphate-sugar epimerase